MVAATVLYLVAMSLGYVRIPTDANVSFVLGVVILISAGWLRSHTKPP
jgi:hypothetical protein